MQWDRHKRAKEKLKEIVEKRENYRIIHYSCQSFNRVENGKTAIITAIAIYSCRSDTTTSFDIQFIAEQKGIAYEDISKEENLKKIETILLNDFFEYIKDDKNCIYLHWNMRDSQYGFQALSNRYAVLNSKKPDYEIPDDKQINIAKLLEDYYGIAYVKDPKMKRILELNPQIKPKYLLFGGEEADAFDNGQYNELNKSTLAKVRFFSQVLCLVEDGNFKIDIKPIKAFGVSPQVIFERVRDKWWWGILTGIVGFLIGYFLNLLL